MNSTSLGYPILPIKPATHVCDLGVMIDNDLSILSSQVHINHVTRTCFYHLRQLRVVRRSLTTGHGSLPSPIELLCTADLITAMEFSLVCFSTRSVGFKPFSVPQLALSLAYPSGQRFGRHARQTTLAPLPRKGRVQTLWRRFTSVYTIAHPGICLNTACMPVPDNRYQTLTIQLLPIVPRPPTNSLKSVARSLWQLAPA